MGKGRGRGGGGPDLVMCVCLIADVEVGGPPERSIAHCSVCVSCLIINRG